VPVVRRHEVVDCIPVDHKNNFTVLSAQTDGFRPTLNPM
jgi:hypothetical protein